MDNTDAIKSLEDRIEHLEKMTDRLETAIGGIKHDTADLVDAFRAAQGGFKVIAWLGKLAAPMVAIGAAWASFKTGLWK